MDPAATIIDAAGGRITMSLPQKTSHTVVATVVGLVLAFLAVDNAAAQDPPLASIRAPFTCDTEWSGGTRSGHGLNNWNLDINSTERTFAKPQYDLGAPLLAQADGTIVWIGWHVSAGTYVEIDYGDITARYIHVVDDSVPEGLEIDSEVVEGQLFG
ncbi:MAG: murein DD-endopeptidase MepM/ murein hydrolase activator NlpD, partial [Candidatus Aldehydirespiratoraceae bacterium]